MNVRLAIKRYLKTLLFWLYRHGCFKHSTWIYNLSADLFPFIIARTELNRGNINEPLQALTKSRYPRITKSKIYRRLDFMNQVLNSDFSYAPNTIEAKKSYNGQVLQVFHSCETYHQNGYAIRSRQIIQCLEESGTHTTNTTRLGYPWDFNQFAETEICTKSKPNMIEYLHRHDPQRLLIDSDAVYIQKYSEYLTALIIEGNHTVIHAHSNFLNGIASSLAAEKANIPSIYEIRGLWHITRCSKDPEFKNSELFQYQEKMEIQAAAMSNIVITLSGALKSWLISKGVSECKISVVPNAADVTSDFIQSQHSDKFVIGYIGSITEYEGLDLVLMAADKLRYKIDNLRVMIVGEGAYKKHLIDLVKKLRLNNIVNFVGAVDHKDVPRYYAQMDVCPIFRKDYDVCKLVPPLKPLEIMSYGKAIIVSDLPPLTEIIEHKIDGLVCPNGNINNLAQQIMTLYNNKPFAIQLGEKAKNKIMSIYSWKKNAGIYINLYSGEQSPHSLLDIKEN